MPWYWTDDMAQILLDSKRIDAEVAQTLSRAPVGYQRPETDVETAALALLDDDEIPLAA